MCAYRDIYKSMTRECKYQIEGNYYGHVRCLMYEDICRSSFNLPGKSMPTYGELCGACISEQANLSEPLSKTNLTASLSRIVSGCTDMVQIEQPKIRSVECIHLGKIVDRLGCNCQRKWKRECSIYGLTSLNGCDTCKDYLPDDPHIEHEEKSGLSMLIRFPHGLGDTIQLTTVLEHIRKLRPDIGPIDYEGKIGAHSALKGYCSGFYLTDRNERAHSGYDWDAFLPWYEPDASYAGIPSTKAEKCLLEMFNIQPNPEWCRYYINIGGEARAAATKYLRDIRCHRLESGKYNAVVVHYFGNTATENKNLSHQTARAICDTAIALGMRPVVLDWERRCPWVDNASVFCPGVDDPLWQSIGTGDAERIAALIDSASLYIGIDSGPDHIAGATTTPTIITWVRHHPIHYYGLADNVTHLVPENHADYVRGDKAVGLKSFDDLYRYEVYSDVTNGITKAMRSMLPVPKDNMVQLAGYWIRTDNIAQDMVIVNDIDKEDAYRLSRLDIQPKDELVIDVGAHIGVFASVYHRLNPLARIICVEACPENLEALRANVGSFAKVIHAACTYETGDVGLLNAVYSDCRSTGGSMVVNADKLTHGAKHGEYWHDARPLPKVTLEELSGGEPIGLLKLDCEGSEFSILQNADLSKLRTIIGEFHGVDRWRELVAQRFNGWEHEYRNTGNGLGNFVLRGGP